MKRWNFYTTKEIKPTGWLRDQLVLQANGLNGNLDKVWPDIRDSAWIGKEREGWERVPYWLDGFVPLAYLLEDQDKIVRAKKYIDAIIANQQKDGWICPCSYEERKNYDNWAVILIIKVLYVYYQCSSDERIPDVIYRTLENYYTLLKEEKIKLFGWGKYRWYECFEAIDFLYRRTGEKWLVDLAKMLKKNGMDYSAVTHLWKRPLNKWTLDTHIVNLAMMLKYEVVSCDILNEQYSHKADQLRDILYKYNGVPNETFTGDECLSGLSPIQGTELCSVVEQMYSYEKLYAYTGENIWAERLEVLAFNALPASLSDDMWAHQYVQMSNQIACETFPGRSLFRTNDAQAHIFGLEPNFGCCTANFGQGWPKFALSSYMYHENEIISSFMLPSTLSTGDVTIKTITRYPFENSSDYIITSKKDFIFKVRIPSFAKNIVVNGEKTIATELSFEIKANERKKIAVRFDTDFNLIDRPYHLKCVKYGSLLFSVPIEFEEKMYEYEKDGVERKYPYCDYEYIPKDRWNYAYCSKEFEINRSAVSKIPFSSKKPAITIKTKAVNIPWDYEDGFETVCARYPESIHAVSDEKDIILYPYGCAKLRMTEIPFLEQ